MKFKETLILHEKLISRLGDDLVYSISYDSGQYFLTISTHKSKTQEFTHGKQTQTALIDDFNDTIFQLSEKLIKLYKGILVKKEEKHETS